MVRGAICGLAFLAAGSALAQQQAQDEPEKVLEATELCRSWTLKGTLKPGLTDTERHLVCGTRQGAWSDIPFQQAKFNLTNFLQARGYHHPVFIQDALAAPAQPGVQPPQGDHYTLIVGEPTRVTSLSAIGAPDTLRLHRKRKVVGEILTPELLGTVENWVFQRLQALGYGCPKATAEANPDTGAIVVNVETGPLQDLRAVVEENIPGALGGILRRYDAFQLGLPFNGDLLTVSSNRIMQQNILQSAYFTVTCDAEGVVAHQRITAGPPRLLTFGIGVDTEGLVQLKAAWRNARLGTHASWVETSAQVSTKDQLFYALMNWYWMDHPSRQALQPSYQLRHQNENAYEVGSTRIKGAFQTTWDNNQLGAQVTAGPVVELIRTYRGSGSGNPNSEFLSAEAILKLRDHEFEYWATNPRTGYDLTLTGTFARGGWLSSASAQRLSLVGEALYNLRDYDPPLLILGLRGGALTTLSSERPGVSSRLPANFFWYLGGSSTLRGFDRQSTPPEGAMTAIYLNPEARLSTVLPFNVEPFVFYDLGFVGGAPLALGSTVLMAPGFGLRYKSPFGTIRTTLARGFPLEPTGGWTFYFSFGEEF
jgi:translocation and assembly module TamA